MESRIRYLCQELLVETDPVKMQEVSAELRLAIREHIQSIREELLAIPAGTPFVPFDKDKAA